MVEIPREALKEELLGGIIDNFILREGTDYGVVELSHESKVNRIKKQIEKDDIKIVFDPNTDSVSLLTKMEFQKLNSSV